MTNLGKIVLSAILFSSLALADGVSLIAEDVFGYGVELRKALKLTDDQVNRLRMNRNEMFVEADSVLSALFVQEKQLGQEREADSPNEAVIGKTTVEADKLREQLDAIRNKYQARARAILTDEQRTALVPIEEAAQRIQLAFEADHFNLVTVPSHGMWTAGMFGEAGSDPIRADADASPGSGMNSGN